MSRRKSASYSDSRRYYDWLDRAGEDIICAGHLMKDDNCYNSAAFHCQQAIEKAIKSYILLKSNILVDGHNLTWLCKRAMRHDKSFATWLAGSAELGRFYIETRYPADIPLNLDYARIKRYHKMAIDMFRFICAEVDVFLSD